MPADAQPTTDPATTAATRAALRAEMPVAERWAYFDHAAVAPLSAPAARAIADWSSQAAQQGDTVWLEWAARVEATRKTAARLVGAGADEIALLSNTTQGINLVAEGVDWREGDNVVTLADEFPSNLLPWLNQQPKGVEVRRVATDRGRLDLDDLRKACDNRTRVVSVSWVGYSTGYRQDIDAIAEIAHDAGALFFLDAIQGLGVLPLSVRDTPIDFLAADGHKWMLGPEGAAVAYFRKENLDRLHATGVGWNSVTPQADFSQITELVLRPSATRFEGGSANMPGQHGLGASLELLTREPTARTAAAILETTDLACERLREIGAELATHRSAEPSGHDPRSGIVAFTLPGREPTEVRKRCLAAGVALSARSGRLRLSAHAYNTADDVDWLIEALRG
ncbi:putative cysteine desulfurase [Pseudobythopirellula maris]|uniref:Putative cysteine desulfurase n=1 Tax=Pseudobythopirellula maris TaxID=2527991 RepID=A0A5C5ZHH0_9BACT|nr:aminotransferase class V-fold PLP-dependent enzyme [Pseudobythopirellula maris]TWT86802.1 putative cysteine desulfurase [Pseudobythopirellula maris]